MIIFEKLFCEPKKMLPEPNVMPTRMEGMREVTPRSAWNTLISSTRKIPKE